MALNLQAIIDEAVKTKGTVAQQSVLNAPTPSEPPSTTIPVREAGQAQAAIPNFNPPPVRSRVAQNLTSITNQLAAVQNGVNNLRSSEQSPNFAQEILNLSNTDLSGQKQQLREDVGLSEKEARARVLGNRIVDRDNNYRDRIEALEQNPEGKLRGALNAELNDLERERSRELADLSFAYNVALGDFQAAESAVNDRIADMEADIKRRTAAFKTAFEFAQNDLSESEKLAAQQAFQREMDATNFEQQKEIARYHNQLSRELAAYKASLQVEAGTDPISTLQAQQQRSTELQSTRQDISVVEGLLGLNRGIGAATGAVQRPLLAGFFQGGQARTNEDGTSPLRNLFRFAPGIGNVQGALDTKNEQNDLLAGVSYLVNSTTFQEVLNLKQGGVTFGNMTEGERIAAGRAANELNSSVEIDANGTVTGIRGSEEKFRENMNTVLSALQEKEESLLVDQFLTPEEQLLLTLQ